MKKIPTRLIAGLSGGAVLVFGLFAAVFYSANSAPDFYQQDHLLQEPVVAAIAEVQAELQKAYQRWEELDSQ